MKTKFLLPASQAALARPLCSFCSFPLAKGWSVGSPKPPPQMGDLCKPTRAMEGPCLANACRPLLIPRAPAACASSPSCKLIAVFNFCHTYLLLGKFCWGERPIKKKKKSKKSTQPQVIRSSDTGNIRTSTMGCSHICPCTSCWPWGEWGSPAPDPSPVLPCGTLGRTGLLSLLQAGFRQVLLSLGPFPSSSWRAVWGRTAGEQLLPGW